MKAKFNISIIRPNDEGYKALSNMDIIEEKQNPDNTTTVSFRQSVPMSTYLACFIVSDFVYKEASVNANGIGADMSIRVYSRPSELDKVDFALDTGARLTEFFIKYFHTEYPLPKLGNCSRVVICYELETNFILKLENIFFTNDIDLAAIPDFVSGAMEHWGLVN